MSIPNALSLIRGICGIRCSSSKTLLVVMFGVWSGDFNFVLHESERRGTPFGGVNSSGSEIRDFSSFVRNVSLFDFPLLGRHFTWCQPNGGAMSRLDRFLLSAGWWDF